MRIFDANTKSPRFDETGLILLASLVLVVVFSQFGPRADQNKIANFVWSRELAQETEATSIIRDYRFAAAVLIAATAAMVWIYR